MTCEMLCIDDDMAPFIDRARALGERDYANRVDVMAGMDAFKLAGATRDELNAYAHGWSRAQLRSIIKAAGLVETA